MERCLLRHRVHIWWNTHTNGVTPCLTAVINNTSQPKKTAVVEQHNRGQIGQRGLTLRFDLQSVHNVLQLAYAVTTLVITEWLNSLFCLWWTLRQVSAMRGVPLISLLSFPFLCPLSSVLIVDLDKIGFILDIHLTFNLQPWYICKIK